MGTRFELILQGDDQRALQAAAEEAIDTIQEWHARLNRFARDSQLAFINRTAAERPLPLDAELFELLALCARVHQASGGAFDPTVAGLMDDLRREVHASAADEDCAPGMHSIILDPLTMTVRFLQPGIALDLGGIAKGFALDRAAELLRQRGIASALLHGGTSSILALGAPHGKPGWTVLVETADQPLRITLRDCHLSVSRPSGRIFSTGAGPHGHIVDPRSRASIAADRTAVVLGPSGAEAEAWSTALVVLGSRPDPMPPELTSALHEPGRGWMIHGDRPTAHGEWQIHQNTSDFPHPTFDIPTEVA